MKSPTRKPKVIVTGGAGFIGHHVTQECLRQGFEATVLDNMTAPGAEVPAGAAIVKADVYSADLVGLGSKLGWPDSVDFLIHLAAVPFIPDSYDYPQLCVNTNVTGTLNVLQLARSLKNLKRIVVISSSEVYGTAQFQPMTESHPLNPQSTYAVTKLAAEQLALSSFREHGLPVVVFRPFNCYGPRESHPYVIPEIIRQCHAGREIRLGNIASVRDFSYVEDTARAIVLCMEHGMPGSIYHYGSGSKGTVSIEYLADKIAELMGRKITITTDESRLRPHDVTWLEASNLKFESEIYQFNPVPFIEGLQKTIDWFYENGARWAWEV